MLNEIRTGTFDDIIDDILKSWFKQQSDDQYPYLISYIFAENSPTKRYHELTFLPDRFLFMSAKDELLKTAT